MKRKADWGLKLTALMLMMLFLAGCSTEPVQPQMYIPAVTQAPQQVSAPVQGYNYSPAAIVQGTGVQEADLTVGYVAAAGSDLHPLRGNSRDLNSINHLVFESVVELDENQQQRLHTMQNAFQRNPGNADGNCQKKQAKAVGCPVSGSKEGNNVNNQSDQLGTGI